MLEGAATDSFIRLLRVSIDLLAIKIVQSAFFAHNLTEEFVVLQLRRSPLISSHATSRIYKRMIAVPLALA